MDAEIVVFVIAVVLVAGTAQTVAGFGYALIAVPCFVTVLAVADAVVLTSLLALANSAVLAATAWRHVPWPTVAPMLAGAVIGMPLGLAVLLFAPADALRLGIAGATLIMTAALAAGLRFGDRNLPSELGVGAIAGVLSTSTGTNGPPIVLYLQGRALPPLEFRAAMAAFFSASGVLSLAVFGVTGVIAQRALLLFVAALPAVAIASWVGHWLAPHIEASAFRRMTLGLLVVSALVAGAAAIARMAA